MASRIKMSMAIAQCENMTSPAIGIRQNHNMNVSASTVAPRKLVRHLHRS